jgi:putative ABC transport system permease protein
MTRTLFIKLLRDVRAAWTRLVLMVAAVGLSLVAFGTVLYARFIVDPQISSGYLSTNPASARIFLDPGMEPGGLDAVLGVMRTEPLVIDATLRRVLTFQMLAESGQVSASPLQLFIAAPDDPLRIGTFKIEQGSWPPPPDGVLLERHALRYLKLSVGDRVVVAGLDGRPVSLRIVGVVHDPSLAPAYEEGKGYGFVSTATLPLLGAEPMLDQLVVTVAAAPGEMTPSRDRDAIVRTALGLADRLQQASGLAIQQIAVPPPYQHPHQAQMNAVLAAILAFGALALLLSAVLIATMINGLLTQQIPQIGILKAIGARSGRVLQLYLLMTLVVVGAATALAFVPGVVLGREWAALLLTNMLNMEVGGLDAPWWTYAAVVATGLGLPLLVALGPVLGASRTTVRAAISAVGGARTDGAASSRFDAWLSRIQGLDRMLLLGLRNSFRRRARWVLSVGLLATAGAIFVGGLNTLAGVQAIPERLAADRRWDVEVGLAAPAPAAVLEGTVAKIPGVTHVETWTTQASGVQYPGEINVTRTYPDQGHGSSGVTVIPPATSVLTPPRVLEGRWLRAGDSDAIVVPHSMRNAMPSLRVGQTIQLPLAGRLTDWTVVGVVEELFAAVCPCVTDVGFERATGRVGQANVLKIVIDGHDPESRLRVGQAVGQALAAQSIKVEYVRPFDWLVEVSEGHLYVLVAVFLLIAAAMGIVGLIGLGSTLSANVIERTREFAVMRAIGARASTVRRIVVAEGVFMAVASCAAAAIPALVLTAAMGAGVGNLFLSTPLPFRVSTAAIAVWIVAIVIGAALASLAPALRASRLTVREALAYV